MSLDEELREVLHGQAGRAPVVPDLAEVAERRGRALVVRRRATAAGSALLVVGGVAFAVLPRLDSRPAEPAATPSPSVAAVREQQLQLGATSLSRLATGPVPRALTLVVDGGRLDQRVVEIRDGRAREVFALPGRVVDQVERTAAGYVVLAAKARIGDDGVPVTHGDDRRILLIRDGQPVELTRGYDGADERYPSVEQITSFAVSPDGRRLAYSRDVVPTTYTEIDPGGSRTVTTPSPGSPVLADLVEIELPSGRVLHRHRSGQDGAVRVVAHTGTEVYVSPDAVGEEPRTAFRWMPGTGRAESLPLSWLGQADVHRGLAVGIPVERRGDGLCAIRLVRLAPVAVLDEYTCVTGFTLTADGTALVDHSSGGTVELRRAPDWQSRLSVRPTYPLVLRDVTWDGPDAFFALANDTAEDRWVVLRCDTDASGCERAYTVPGSPETVRILD